MSSAANWPEPNNLPSNAPPEGTAEAHLASVLSGGVAEPWFKTAWANLQDMLHPEKLPPLEVTSKPVAVKDIWGAYGGNESKSRLMSVGAHVGVILLALLIGTNPAVQKKIKDAVPLIAPDISPYMPKKAQVMGGGGGGGDRSPVPQNKGKLPRPAPKQFTPPMAVVNNPQPKLVMEPTLIMQTDAPIPQVNMPNYGDPLAKLGPPSNGSGSGAGIGSGSGGGVGSGGGAGFGPGQGGNMGGGVYRIGGGVSSPSLLFKVEPEYSEEARKAKFQGVVVLYVVVDEKGTPRELRVVRPLGLGLDEKAIEAVQKWRFKPGLKDGRPVAVAATIEVNFRLL